jgi:hypothetical protein
MSRVSIRLPDSLHKQLREWASAQGTSIDQLISSAVAEKLAALLSPEYLEARAKRASRNKFEAALKTVPDVEAPEYDRLPNQKLRPTAAQRGKKRRPAKPSGPGR